ADKFGAELAACGVASTVSPLLEIELLPLDTGAFEGTQGLIATSRNGLRALAAGPALVEAVALPIYVVGPGTAELARALGFSKIIAG
ncbi:uroporphyrinogen-III synthase, partial [Staphylococcus aureus]